MTNFIFIYHFYFIYFILIVKLQTQLSFHVPIRERGHRELAMPAVRIFVESQASKFFENPL